jgi:hypothetical protein
MLRGQSTEIPLSALRGSLDDYPNPCDPNLKSVPNYFHSIIIVTSGRQPSQRNSSAWAPSARSGITTISNNVIYQKGLRRLPLDAESSMKTRRHN